MRILTYALIVLSALALVLAIIGTVLRDPIMAIQPEAYSRAANNLVLIAIALAVCLKKDSAKA